jgi:hypothetical protein
MKRFTVNAVKWFDGVNGNTYHSCRITRHRDGKVIVCAYQYGYGDQYKQTVLEAMKKADWIRPKAELYSYEREHNYPVIWIATHGLKRDCIANGVI